MRVVYIWNGEEKNGEKNGKDKNKKNKKSLYSLYRNLYRKSIKVYIEEKSFI